jgi:CTP synthase (UTP-ammonia lyase)
VLNIRDAEHEETAPDAPRLLISRLACSLVGETQTIRVFPGSQAWQAYGKEEVTEQFFCNYGVNPAYRSEIEKGPLRITGIDADGGARIIEIPGHRFYVATLFVPQIASRRGSPHPVIVAYLRAALVLHLSRNDR